MGNIIETFKSNFEPFYTRDLDFDISSLSEENKNFLKKQINEYQKTFHEKINIDFFKNNDYSWVSTEGAFDNIVELQFQQRILQVLNGLYTTDNPQTDYSNICVRSLPTGELMDEAIILDGYKYIIASTQFNRAIGFSMRILQDCVSTAKIKQINPSDGTKLTNYLGGRSLYLLCLDAPTECHLYILRAIVLFFSLITYTRPPFLELGFPGYVRFGMESKGKKIEDYVEFDKIRRGLSFEERISISHEIRFYSLLHELVHLLFHDYANNSRNTSEEEEADVLAMKFLRRYGFYTSEEASTDIDLGYDKIINVPAFCCAAYYGLLQTINFFRMTKRWMEKSDKPQDDEFIKELMKQRDELEARHKMAIKANIMTSSIRIASDPYTPNEYFTTFSNTYEEFMFFLDCCKSMIIDWMAYKTEKIKLEDSKWDISEVDYYMTFIKNYW